LKDIRFIKYNLK